MEVAVDYNGILQKAYKVSMYYVKEDDTAKDIAQATAIKYYLNCETIDMKGSNSWIYKVSKNLSLNHLKKSKRVLIYSNSYFEDKIYANSLSQKEILGIEDIEIFNIKEKQLLREYYEKSSNLGKLSKKYKMKLSVLKNKIYNLEKERKLFELIHEGVISTSSIPGTKLHRNIQNFLSKLKICLQNNDLSKMKHYFSKCVINDEVNSIQIKKIVQYDIDILGHDKFMLNIGYKDPFNEVNFFRLSLEISNGSTINVIEFPIVPKKVFASNVNEIPIEVLRQLQVNEKGVVPLSQEDIMKLIETQKDKIKVLVEKKNCL